MKFFDSLIRETEKLLAFAPAQEHLQGMPWSDAGQQQMILRRDTAFELEGVGFNLITSGQISDGIVVAGDNLSAIRENRPFARITLVQVEDDGDAQAAYNLIKKIDYVKYHIFPDGYMMRSASRSHQEAVRVSKNAIQRGIAFQGIGSLMIERYKQIPAVRGVRVFFITDPKVNYSQFEVIARKNHEVTETLNHVMNKMVLDCNVCKLKSICDEAEGMKALHFRQLNL